MIYKLFFATSVVSLRKEYATIIWLIFKPKRV